MEVTIPKVIQELLNSDRHSERIAGVRGLGQLATDNNNRELAQLAIEEIKIIYNSKTDLNTKTYALNILIEAGIFPSEEKEKKHIDTIQHCHELIEAERWREAAECFRNILQRDINNEEARLGFRRAWHGEEAVLDFQQAVIRLAWSQLDDAYELLKRVVEHGEKHDFQIKGSQEILQRVGLHRQLRDKREELQDAKREEDWPKAVRLLGRIIELDPKDERAKTELEKATQERDLQGLYQKLVQNIENEEWIPAEEKTRQIETICLDYKDIPNLKEKVENNKRWEAWYSDLKRDIEAGRWDDAIETYYRIREQAGSRYKNVYQLFEEAERAKKIEANHQQAVLEFEGDQLDTTLDLLQSILDQDPDHEEAKRLKEQVQKVIDGEKTLSDIPDPLKDTDLTTVHDKLERVGTLFEGLDEDHPAYKTYRTIYEKWQELWNEEVVKGKQRVDNLVEQGQWKLARTRLNELVARKFIEPTDEYHEPKLAKIKAELRKDRLQVIGIIVGIIGIVVTILTLDYADILKVAGGIFPTSPTSTPVILSIARVEVWMDGGQLNLDQLPSPTSGDAVVLEVIAFDTDGKRYTSDDLVCRWSVAPLGDNDERIDTELCKVPYTPSQEYSQQVVILEEVEGLEQQFEPIDPIPMTFDIK